MIVNFWQSHGPAIVERLESLFARGDTCSQIARILSSEFGESVTRNSVIGKVHRLGLQSTRPPGFRNLNQHSVPKDKPKSRAVRRLRKSGSATHLRVIRTFESVEVVRERAADVVPLHIGLHDLTAETCRFPYGEGPFTFCGCAPIPGRPYCEPHEALCFNVNHGERRADTEQRKRDYLRSKRAVA